MAPPETVNSVKLVAPPAGGERPPLAQAVVLASRARWQMQGFASTEQVVFSPVSTLHTSGGSVAYTCLHVHDAPLPAIRALVFSSEWW